MTDSRFEVIRSLVAVLPAGVLVAAVWFGGTTSATTDYPPLKVIGDTSPRTSIVCLDPEVPRMFFNQTETTKHARLVYTTQQVSRRGTHYDDRELYTLEVPPNIYLLVCVQPKYTPELEDGVMELESLGATKHAGHENQYVEAQ